MINDSQYINIWNVVVITNSQYINFCCCYYLFVIPSMECMECIECGNDQ